jgi:hypothetical protein
LAPICRPRKVQFMKGLITTACRVFLGVMLILVIFNSPHLLDRAMGKVTGWDDDTKQMYADQVALNNQYMEIAKARETLCRVPAEE